MSNYFHLKNNKLSIKKQESESDVYEKKKKILGIDKNKKLRYSKMIEIKLDFVLKLKLKLKLK